MSLDEKFIIPGQYYIPFHKVIAISVLFSSLMALDKIKYPEIQLTPGLKYLVQRNFDKNQSCFEHREAGKGQSFNYHYLESQS